jgi:nitroreductase
MSTAAHRFASTQDGTDDLWEAIYTTRAIRYFRTDPVPEELIWKVIEAGTMAPSGGNTQPWGFVVVRDPEIRGKIADAIRRNVAGDEGMRTLIDSAPTADRPTRLMLSGVGNLVANFDEAPVLIIPCLYHVTSPAPDGLLAGSSIFQAAQNILLAARGLGLATVFTTFQPAIGELDEWLGLPEEATAVAMIPVGWPERNFGPLNRNPVQTVTHWDRWGRQQERSA